MLKKYTMDSSEIPAGIVITSDIADASVTQPKMKIKTVVALADAAAVLSATQMIDSGLFTITPTVARALTTDTAVNLVAGMSGYQVGTWFDFTIVNTAAFDVTLTAGGGVTLSGGAIIHKESATWRVRFDSATAVTIYNTALGVPAAGIAAFLATSSSANLITAVTDETGSGALVFATSPTLVTPLLGTPTSGTLTSCTGLPTGGVTMAATAKILGRATAGAGVAEEIAVTGTGSVVLATSPTLVTPLLGTPTSGVATNITGLPTAGLVDAAVTRTKQSAPSGSKSIVKEGTTIATTGAISEYIIAPEAGSLSSIEINPLVALATSDTNYITWTVVNLGQDGAGTTAMLAVVDANTTKATGGTALAINTKRALTVHGTGANLVVAQGDKIQIVATASGTLANTVTVPIYILRFSGTT